MSADAPRKKDKNETMAIDAPDLLVSSAMARSAVARLALTIGVISILWLGIIWAVSLP
jgi:hypothetical protein